MKQVAVSTHQHVHKYFNTKQMKAVILNYNKILYRTK